MKRNANYESFAIFRRSKIAFTAFNFPIKTNILLSDRFSDQENYMFPPEQSYRYKHIGTRNSAAREKI